MAPSSSSTRKAAKLAQKGKGKRVRFQGGTLFPMVVAIVLVLGLGLIVYARTSRPAADASPPQIYRGVDASGQTVGDHWHGAYGFQVCSDFPNVQLAGDLEAQDTQGNLISQAMQTTGIHSHDDGVIHWHAWSSRASGRNAQIGIFLDNYDVSLSDDTLEFPEGDDDTPLSRLIFRDATGNDVGAPADADEFPLKYEEGETQCNGEDADLRVVVWTSPDDPDSQQVYRSNFGDIPFNQDGLVITIAFVPDDVDVVMPAWAANLAELGAVDSGTGVIPDDSTVPDTTTDGTSAGDTTEAAGETTDVSETTAASETTEASDTTEAADSTEASDTTEAADTTEG